MMKEIIKKFEEETGNIVIYVSLSGSKLYGTDNPKSDTDYKGIFIPRLKSVTLKTDINHWKHDSNPGNIKNTAEDIDLQFDSIYKFFSEIKNGETGALDMLFSMFREDTIVFQKKEYTDILRDNYSRFLNRELNSFVGYAIGQSKKFNIKGNRFKELQDFNKKLYMWTDKRLNWKVDDKKGSWEQLKMWVNAGDYKYIKFVMSKGPMTSLDKFPQIEYLEVLGSKYPGAITCGDLFEHTKKMEDGFGNRTKKSAKNINQDAIDELKLLRDFV